MADHLIDDIYEAAFVPELWPAVLESLGQRVGAPAASLMAFDDLKPVSHRATAIVHQANDTFFGTDLWKENQRLQYSRLKPITGFVIAQDYYPPGFLDADAGFRLRRDVGLEAQIGTIIPMPSGEVVAFALEKWRQDGAFGQEDVDALNVLYPHLARAGLMAARLGLRKAQAAVAALEVIGLPAAVITNSGRVLASNPLLDAEPVLLSGAFGRFALADRAADRLFQQALDASRSGAQPPARSIPVAAFNEAPSVVVHMLPLRRSAYEIFGGDILVVATAVTARNLVPSPTLLSSLFDLAPAEAKLAAALAGGVALKEAAAEQNIRITTARNYLEMIFRKTNTHRQGELIALLNRTIPMQRQRRCGRDGVYLLRNLIETFIWHFAGPRDFTYVE